MRKLYLTLIGMTLVFACAMSFATLAVYVDAWWPGVVAAGVVAVFLAIGGAVIPGSLRSLSGGYARTARAAVIAASSWWGLELFVMALITWILGKRSVGPNNAYLTLGLLIFLGFVGLGIQGFLATTAWFVHVRNESIVVPRRRERLEREARLGLHDAQEHGSFSGHTPPVAQA
ncbi:MAG: hypothetical protein M0Z46_14380 [Actinomycetota bacterium]|nr:hypothetical protein [Actinomycetota bacterium]